MSEPFLSVAAPLWQKVLEVHIFLCVAEPITISLSYLQMTAVGLMK